MKKHLQVIKNDTCFSAHERNKKSCKKEECQNWFNNKQYQNCILIAAKTGPMTLTKVGEIIGISRMRICQVLKRINAEIEAELKAFIKSY